MKGRDFPVSRWRAGLGRFFSLAWVTQKSFPSCNLSAVLILLIDYLSLIPESWSVPFGASTPFAPLPQLRVVVGPPPLRLLWSIWKPPYLQVAAETPFSHPGEVVEPRCCLATGFCREERFWFGFLEATYRGAAVCRAVINHYQISQCYSVQFYLNNTNSVTVWLADY